MKTKIPTDRLCLAIGLCYADPMIRYDRTARIYCGHTCPRIGEIDHRFDSLVVGYIIKAAVHKN